jgi:SAM-dependent methyltransferase
MGQAKGYVDAGYLAAAASLMAGVKRRTFELMRLAPGRRVLDLGCGPGTDTLDLAALVAPDGEVCGLDHDAQMIALADERAAAAGLSGRVVHRQGDAAALPWADARFDAVKSERVFQHLLEPDRAFAEVLRVTRPGGWIVIMDGDWAAMTVDADDWEVERKLVRFHAERMIHNPYSGRRLHRLFTAAGLEEIALEVWPVFQTDPANSRRLMRLDQIADEALAAGAIDADERRRWDESLARAAACGSLFTCTNAVVAAGRRPAG